MVKNQYDVGIALSYLFDSKYRKLGTEVFNYYPMPAQELLINLALMYRFIAAPRADTNNGVSQISMLGK